VGFWRCLDIDLILESKKLIIAFCLLLKVVLCSHKVEKKKLLKLKLKLIVVYNMKNIEEEIGFETSGNVF
jgi:hypothetical protein